MKLVNKIKFGLALFLIISPSFALSEVVHKNRSNKTSKVKEAEEKQVGHTNLHHSNSNLIRHFFPNENVDIKIVKNSVILSGIVSSPEVAIKIEQIVKEGFGRDAKILNFMQIKSSQQVMLSVKIAEVSAKNLEILNSKSNLDDLHRRGLVKILAQPNLVALSGESAQFVSGGEFPVPSYSKDGMTIVDYKSYGLKVDFTPIVINQSKIKINVEPELSEISDKRKSTIKGFDLPSIETRKVRTTVELAPGESFMIAGLIKQSAGFLNARDTELVIAVTPHLVEPVAENQLVLPTDRLYTKTKLEKKFINDLSGGDQSELEGPMGFISK